MSKLAKDPSQLTRMNGQSWNTTYVSQFRNAFLTELLTCLTVDVVSSVVNTLLTLSRTNKRPSFGSIFLLNNISYFRTHILIEPKTDIPSLLSKQARDLLESNFRTAKAAYFDSNFSPLMQTLTEEKGSKSSAAKEKFTKFFDLLEEVAERHRLARVLQDDKDGRDTMCDEVVKLVVPSLQRFTQRNTGKEFSKSEFYSDLACLKFTNIIYVADPQKCKWMQNSQVRDTNYLCQTSRCLVRRLSL